MQVSWIIRVFYLFSIHFNFNSIDKDEMFKLTSEKRDIFETIDFMCAIHQLCGRSWGQSLWLKYGIDL